MPMRIGTGRRAESAIVHRARRGGRAASARALTVLVLEARTAGTIVATTATAAATTITIPIVDRSSVGAPGAPTRLAPGFVRSGAASQPMTRPAAAATTARASCLLLHPAADEQRDAGQSEEPQERAPRQQDRPLNGDDQPILGGDGLPRDEKESPVLVRGGECGCVGGIGQLQVERVTKGATCRRGQL
jgi:hypothetical protein